LILIPEVVSAHHVVCPSSRALQLSTGRAGKIEREAGGARKTKLSTFSLAKDAFRIETAVYTMHKDEGILLDCFLLACVHFMLCFSGGVLFLLFSYCGISGRWNREAQWSSWLRRQSCSARDMNSTPTEVICMKTVGNAVFFPY